MNRIVVDATFKARLTSAGGVVRIEDERGVLLGQFVAATTSSGCTLADPIPDTAELERRFRESSRYSSEHVLQRLAKLRGSPDEG